MPTKVSIAVNKPGIPSGAVLIEDAASLAQGIHDVLARLIQRQMGFPGRTRLRDDAKRLAALVLTGLSKGSGVLECETLPLPDLPTRAPAGVAGFDLVHGIRVYQSAGVWPSYLPGVVRNRIGSAVAPVIGPGVTVSITVSENGNSAMCTISSDMRLALQAPETFTLSEAVEVVGNVFDLNNANRTFKVDTSPRKITIHATEDQFRFVDREIHWGRVFVEGIPLDQQCRAVADVLEIRLAAEEEENGVTIPAELERGIRTAAYRAALERAAELRKLKSGYSTYTDKPVVSHVLEFALDFLRDTASVLLDFEIEPPVPFMVPTPSGGVQYEWRVDNRELELEFGADESFIFLAVNGPEEREGRASRWEAVRLIRWVATGEQV
jgi:hypothetical protein